MDFFEQCTYLNMNPVLLAWHFLSSTEFFKVIVINRPLGKVKYHAIRVEFQVCGIPHNLSFLWIVNASVLSKDNVVEYTQWRYT